MSVPPRRRPRPRGFQPRFTLMMLYFFAFFFAYCFALVWPALNEIANMPVSGPEQQRLAEQATREALRGKLWIALAASTATTGLGIWARLLPGLRPQA